MLVKIALVAFFFVITQAFDPTPNPYDNPIYFGDEFLDKWSSFRGKFNKTYATQTEESVRMMIFRMNLMAIDDHNNAGHGFEMGITYFTDMTPREFSKVLGTSPKAFLAEEEDSGETAIDSGEGIEPRSDEEEEKIDHSKDKCIGPVEHQQTCGSCWAFSTSHVAAWHLCKKNGKYINLSEQQLVDCSKKDNGCTSGYTKTAGKYIVKNGIAAEEDYPYKSAKDKCRKELLTDKQKLHKPISGTKSLPKKESAMRRNLKDKGPLMVIIDASKLAFYSGGVISESFCDHGEVNHAVVLVGAEKKEWKVKNSWGPEWGEGGYFRLEIGNKADKGCLGIAGYPSYALP